MIGRLSSQLSIDGQVDGMGPCRRGVCFLCVMVMIGQPADSFYF